MIYTHFKSHPKKMIFEVGSVKNGMDEDFVGLSGSSTPYFWPYKSPICVHGSCTLSLNNSNQNFSQCELNHNSKYTHPKSRPVKIKFWAKNVELFMVADLEGLKSWTRVSLYCSKDPALTIHKFWNHENHLWAKKCKKGLSLWIRKARKAKSW